MKCPVCNSVDLLMMERQAVEIDYCPQCRGVWLDRGELEKIIERTHMTLQQTPVHPENRYERNDHDDDDDHHGYGKPGKRHRRGFLGEMFDF